MTERDEARTAFFTALSAVLLRCCADRGGSTALEYALVAAFTSIAIIGGLTLLGDSVNQEWNWVATVVNTAMAR